jgi:hypothetical protein
MYQPTVEDTLRYEDVKGANIVASKTILQNMNRDPCNPKVYRNCPTCKHPLARQVRVGEDMRLINACIKCNNQWLDMGE